MLINLNSMLHFFDFPPTQVSKTKQKITVKSNIISQGTWEYSIQKSKQNVTEFNPNNYANNVSVETHCEELA